MERIYFPGNFWDTVKIHYRGGASFIEVLDTSPSSALYFCAQRASGGSLWPVARMAIVLKWHRQGRDVGNLGYIYILYTRCQENDQIFSYRRELDYPKRHKRDNLHYYYFTHLHITFSSEANLIATRLNPICYEYMFDWKWILTFIINNKLK